MITLEVNGVRVEAETEKEARRELGKLMKQARAEEAAKQARYASARLKAEAAGYRLLSRHASGEGFPHGWTLYVPGDKWAKHLFNPVARDPMFDSEPRAHTLNALETSGVELEHYGNRLVGAVCNGSGYCWLVFLQDRSNEQEVTCYAIGVEEGTIAIADCPGIKMEQFRRTKEVA